MRFHKSFVFLSLFLILFSSVIAQKIVEDIKPEKQFKKLTNFKDKRMSFEGLDWTPDGKFIVYSKENKIYKFDLENGRELELFSFYSYRVESIKISPSGKKIGVVLRDFFSGHLGISVKNLGDKVDTELTFHNLNNYETGAFVWSPDEKKLIFPFLYGNEYYGIGEFDIEKKKFREVKRLSGYIGYTNIASNYIKNFYVIVEEKRNNTKFSLLDLTQHNLKRTVNIVLNLLLPEISGVDCQGDYILFTAELLPPLSEKYGYSRQILRYNLKDSTVHILTQEKENTSLDHVRYSPDCKKIAFFSNRDGAWNIWLLNLEEEHK